MQKKKRKRKTWVLSYAGVAFETRAPIGLRDFEREECFQRDKGSCEKKISKYYTDDYKKKRK